MWKPIKKDRILEDIENCNHILTGVEKRFWDLVKIDIEKWKQHPWGDKGEGFWVVAIYGQNCIYYNDIEHGYNVSRFNKYGIIDEYGCNQLELYQLINSIVEYKILNDY